MSAPECVFDVEADKNGNVIRVRFCPYCLIEYGENRALHYWLEVSGARGVAKGVPCARHYSERVAKKFD